MTALIINQLNACNIIKRCLAYNWSYTNKSALLFVRYMPDYMAIISYSENFI